MSKKTKTKVLKEKKPKEKMHSNKIKVVLEEIGMSQQELADLALDGNKGHLSRIINGQRRCISMPTAIRISSVLKRPVEEIFIYKIHNENKKEAPKD